MLFRSYLEYVLVYVSPTKPSNCLKYVTSTYWVKSTKSGEYVWVTYFKQLESLVGDTYTNTYSKYVNTIANHTYSYQAF